MTSEEILKECKTAYEILYDLLENASDDFDDEIFKATMEELGTIYSENWHDNLPPKELHCFRCGSKLKISDLIDYAYLCEDCDENMYLSECEGGYAWWLEKECE